MYVIKSFFRTNT